MWNDHGMPRMPSPRRAFTAASALLATALLLTGCVRTDAELTIDGRTDVVEGTITLLAPLKEDTTQGHEQAASEVLAVENVAFPSLRHMAGVKAAPLSEDGAYGTRYTLRRVPIADLTLGAQGEDAGPFIQRVGDTFQVFATIDAPAQPGVTPAEEGADGEGGEGGELADIDAAATAATIRVSLTFPGQVIDVGGSSALATIDGRTVTWEAPWDEAIVLEATAGATAAAAPSWIWAGLLWALAAIVVLAILGLLTVWWRSRND